MRGFLANPHDQGDPASFVLPAVILRKRSNRGIASPYLTGLRTTPIAFTVVTYERPPFLDGYFWSDLDPLSLEVLFVCFLTFLVLFFLGMVVHLLLSAEEMDLEHLLLVFLLLEHLSPINVVQFRWSQADDF